jgi:hypothetical protein
VGVLLSPPIRGSKSTQRRISLHSGNTSSIPVALVILELFAMVESELGEGRFTAYVGTISYRLSDRNFADFVRTGAQSNDLPYFVERLGVLQTRLEGVNPREFAFKPERRSETLGVDDRLLQLERLTVISISYEAGSVLAKIQVGAVIVASTITIASSAASFLADYQDAKVGFGHLRDDVVSLAREVFTPGQPPKGDDGQQPQPSQPLLNEEISFYFSRPERFEEAIRKSLQKKPANQ